MIGKPALSARHWSVPTTRARLALSTRPPSALDAPCTADGGSYHEGMGRPQLIRRLLDIAAGVTDKRGESALQRRGASVEPPIAVRVADGPDIQFWLSSCTPRRKMAIQGGSQRPGKAPRGLHLPPPSSPEPLAPASVAAHGAAQHGTASRCLARSA